MAYSTLSELVDAYRSGQLGPEHRLVIDNDDVSVYGPDDEPCFSAHPAELLEAALDLLGVPHEHV